MSGVKNEKQIHQFEISKNGGFCCDSYLNETTLGRRNIFKLLKMEGLSNGQASSASNGVTEIDIDLEFLPIIYEIIKSIERDPTHDSTQKPRDSQDTSAKILELEKKLNQARERINQLPGIEHSQVEQLKQVENLRKQLLLKRQLINKYRNTFTFSVPK